MNGYRVYPLFRGKGKEAKGNGKEAKRKGKEIRKLLRMR